MGTGKLNYLSKLPVSFHWKQTEKMLYYTICQRYLSAFTGSTQRRCCTTLFVKDTCRAFTGSTQRRCCTTLFVKDTCQLSLEAHREDVVLHYLSKIPVSLHWKHTEEMLYYTIWQSYMSAFSRSTQRRCCTTLFDKVTCQLSLEAHRDVVLHYLSKLPVIFHWKHADVVLHYLSKLPTAFNRSTQRRCTTLFVKYTCQLSLEAHRDVVLHNLSKLPVSYQWKHTEEMLYYTICQRYLSAYTGSTQIYCTTLFVKVTCQLTLEAHTDVVLHYLSKIPVSLHWKHRGNVVLHYLSKIPVSLHWKHTQMLYYTICQRYLSAYTGSTHRCCTTLFVKITCQLTLEAHRGDVVLHYLSKLPVSFHWKHTEKMLYYTICQRYLSAFTGST